jgi:two-component system phosphate regulon sensor histidine kinase PhoR
MARTFKWRLTISYLILILFFLCVVGITVTRSVDKFYMENLRHHLMYESRLVAELVQDYDFVQPSSEMAGAAVRASHDTEARITIIAADGTVLADSQEDISTMANHRNRPEVAAALRGDNYSVIRYSSTLRTNMMYVAVPVVQEGQIPGAVRISLPLMAIKSLIHRLWWGILAVMILAGLLATALSLKFVSTLTRPISDMTEVARSLAAGNLKSRVLYNREDEIGVLARTMNTMAHNLNEKLSEISKIKSRLETVLKNTVNGIILVNPENQITFINPAACKLLGVSEKGAMGKQYIEIIRSYSLAECIDTVFREREAVRKELVLHSIGDKTVETSIAPVTDIEGFRGVLVVLNDITELKRLEMVRKDFVANVSHELKTPLTSISGFAETLLVENPENQTVQEFSRIIYDEAQRLARLVNSLLQLSRLESAEANLKMERLDLVECVKYALEGVEPSLTAKQIMVHLDFPPGEVVAAADRDLLTQVLVNLLDNAIKHSPEGAAIRIGLEEQEDEVLVTVTDKGPGIAQEERNRIFERFYRVDKARTRRDGGAGLGLSIVKHIVEIHGGRVGVESRPGQGSNFYFTLPWGQR